MTSSVDPTAEMAAIMTRLGALPEHLVSGAEQGHVFPLTAFGRKKPYRDFEPGSVIPSGQGRLLAAGEQSQPYIWSFQVHHVAPTRDEVFALSVDTDKSLIGWSPSSAASPIGTFFFNMYDEFNKNGETVQWIATRFYETTLGQSPDM